jgi:hypothetical protein
MQKLIPDQNQNTSSLRWVLQTLPKAKIGPASFKAFCASTCLYNNKNDEILIFGGAVSKYIYDQSYTPLIIYSLSPQPNEKGYFSLNAVATTELSKSIDAKISNAQLTSLNINCYCLEN